jgi:organic radical activating enzyme
MNNQKAEGAAFVLELDVIDIWNTIQGEGPFAGTPAVFIRLAGCTLQCPGCDTNYTCGRRLWTVEEVVRKVWHVRGTSDLVVITGGEPLRQSACLQLFHSLSAREIQLETNGVSCPFTIPWFVTTVCSPKTTKISPDVEAAVLNCGAYKYVVESGYTADEDGLPLRVLGKDCHVARPPRGFRTDKIFIQPMDNGDVSDRANLTEAVRVCRKFGYRLCLQVHKIVGLA